MREEPKGPDPFAIYRKMYPTLDINEEYRKARAKLKEEPGRVYFERWLAIAVNNTLEIPEELKEKAKPKRYYADQFPIEPLTAEEVSKYEGRSGSSGRKAS